jgi:GGDEF domain-containing protein
VAHYAIDLDDEITAPHRQYLVALAGEVASARPEALAESRATLRGLLRDYRDKAAKYLGALREELAGSVRALQEILDSLAQSDSDHEAQLRTELARLREISASLEEGAVRAAILAAADSIEQSLEQIRQQHQLTVSQFLVEIRMLHKRIDLLEAAASLDDLTKLFKRDEIERQIRSVPDGKLCLLLVRATGFRQAEQQFDREVAAELAAAFSKRLRNCLPSGTAIGRWSEEEFIAMLSMEEPEAMASAKRVAERLDGDYACLQSGKTVHPSLHVGVAVVDGQPGDPPERTLKRINEFLVG